MSDVNWRVWMYDQLSQDSAVLAMLNGDPPEASIYGAGSLAAIPEFKPFIVIHVGDEFKEFPGVSKVVGTIWIHDQPGSYNTIDALSRACRNALCGPNESFGPVFRQGGIACRWEADGPDQSDEVQGTLMRSSQFAMVGKDGNA